MLAPLILGKSLLKRLVEAGIVPERSRRVIIDIQPHEAVAIYVEQYGDERLLGIIPPGVEGAKIVLVDKGPAPG